MPISAACRTCCVIQAGPSNTAANTGIQALKAGSTPPTGNGSLNSKRSPNRKSCAARRCCSGAAPSTTPTGSTSGFTCTPKTMTCPCASAALAGACSFCLMRSAFTKNPCRPGPTSRNTAGSTKATNSCGNCGNRTGTITKTAPSATSITPMKLKTINAIQNLCISLQDSLPQLAHLIGQEKAERLADDTEEVIKALNSETIEKEPEE